MIGSGWRSALSRRLVLAAAVAVIPVMTGCEATNNAPTLDFHPPTETAATNVGSLSIRNVFVLGAPLGHDLAKGQSASLFLAMVNSGSPDTLVSITAPGIAASVTLPGSVPVVFGHPVSLTGPQPRLVLTDLTRPLANGTSIKLVLLFKQAGPVTMLVPVMARATHYITYAPPQPVASISPTPSPSITARHRRSHPVSSASPTVTPSVPPSPSPSPSTT